MKLSNSSAIFIAVAMGCIGTAGAQTYKVGDKHPDGGFVIFVDASGTQGVVVDDEDSGRLTPPAAIEAAKTTGNGWSMPSLGDVKGMYQLHQLGIGGFKAERYQSLDASSPHYRWAINFGSGQQTGDVAQNNLVLVRFVKKFAPAKEVHPDGLAKGHRLNVGERHYSKNKKFYLTITLDGTLAIFDAFRKDASDRPYTVWAEGEGGTHATMQEDDGNFCLYDDAKGFKWGTQAYGPKMVGGKVSLSDEGFLEQVDDGGNLVWSSR